MNLFSTLPAELENIIWEYIGLFKLRNGNLVRQIKHLPIMVDLFTPSNKYCQFNNYSIWTKYILYQNGLHFFIRKNIYLNKIIYSSGMSGKKTWFTFVH